MLKLYFHTIKFLKPAQILGRFWFRFYKPVWLPVVALERRKITCKAEFLKNKRSMIGPDRFEFLNRIETVDLHAGWNGKHREALWNYNLHYFDDLNSIVEVGRHEWHESFIDSWITHNPIGSSPGWDSYPTSLRIVNWIKYLIGKDSIPDRVSLSLIQQSKWLQHRIEYHLLGNHIWANAKALLFTGCFFNSRTSDKWLCKGIKILNNCLEEHILEDGGHYEGSPMYHAIVLADILDIMVLNEIFPGNLSDTIVSKLRACSEMMLQWLDLMSRPDGSVSHFKDSVSGVAFDQTVLTEFAKNLSVRIPPPVDNGLIVLKESGYAISKIGVAKLICNVSDIKPSYQPGHAHADTLSFEFYLFAKAIFCNSGVSTYEEGDLRGFQRSTRAHNTVEINAQNSSEVWKSFRVGRRAKPFGFEYSSADDSYDIRCKHDGYRRDGKHIIHERHWQLNRNQLRVEDTIYGEFTEAVGRLYLHPAVMLKADGKDTLALRVDDHVLNLRLIEGEMSVVTSEYYPEFGVSAETRCIEIVFTSQRIAVEISW